MLEKYCKVGINHHLLYPGVLSDPHLHEVTLNSLYEIEGFQVIDLSLPSDAAVRKREISLIRSAGKEIIYNFPLFSLEPGANADPNSGDICVRENALDRAKEQLSYAAEAGARTVTFASGPDQGLASREALLHNFIEYSCLFGEELKKYGITALLEPFDRSIGKCLLIGPTAEAVEYIKTLRNLGVDNIALMADMGHLPLMGDSFREAIPLSLPYLHHVHLGNCVMKNPASPYYGDKHPPLGIDGGENDMAELTEFLSVLLQTGYITEGGKNTVSIEARPYPGVSSELSARVGLEKLNAAMQSAVLGGG